MRPWMLVLALVPSVALASSTVEWTTERVDAVCSGSRNVEIEFDQNQLLYLGYSGCHNAFVEKREAQMGPPQPSPTLLKIASRNAAGGWDMEVVDDSGKDVGRHPNISFDDENGMHISYADHETWRMKYARRAAGEAKFDIQNIGSNLGGYWVSGGLFNGVFYATHTRFSNRSYGSPRLELVSLGNGVQNTAVIQNFDGGWNTFVGGNAATGPVFASMGGYQGYRGTIFLTYKKNGAWFHEAILPEATRPDFTVDSKGFFHLTYSQSDAIHGMLDNVGYATNAPDGVWRRQVVAGNDSEFDDAIFSSIAVDQDGGVHIAYKDFANKVLMYKRKRGSSGAWETFQIASNGNPIYSRMKVDARNRLHIAFEMSDNIYYGVCEGCTDAR